MTGLDQAARREIVAAALRAAGVPDPRPAGPEGRTMTLIRLVEHERDDARSVHLVLADEHLVGTAVELAGDRIAPWRLTIRGCCANLRYSSRLVVEQAVARFIREFPEAFVPTGPVPGRPARTRSVEPITPPPPTAQETST